MQKQFKYIYNNQEVSKEEFEKLSEGNFKWFDGDSILSVPFSSFDNFFNGEFKSRRQINDHIKSILNVNDCKFTMCGQKSCIRCYPTKNTNSTRHKVKEEGKFHKDDIITNSNRREKETLQGVKESQSVDKAPIFTYCKVNKNALEALALRALYGHEKYKEFDEDWQNFTRVPNADEEYANAQFRHALGVGGEETTEEHLTASAWNAIARLEIYLRNKLNKC